MHRLAVSLIAGIFVQSLTCGSIFSETTTVPTVQRQAQKVSPADRLGQLLSDLDQQALQGNVSVIVGSPLEPRSRYQDYLKNVAPLSRDLLHIRKTVRQHGGRLSLQELGALTQHTAHEYQRLCRGFTQGEAQLESFRLISQAITSLEDTLRYWRLANKYRSLSWRGLADAKNDDAVLRHHLQKAMSAIDQLAVIVRTREALEKKVTAD